MEKYGFVYLWRDRKHNRYYIGCHWGSETDKYICSSRWMRKAYKRRSGDFKRRILFRVYTTRMDLLIEEYTTIEEVLEEAGYSITADNLHKVGLQPVGCNTSETVHLFIADVTGIIRKKKEPENIWELNSNLIQMSRDEVLKHCEWRGVMCMIAWEVQKAEGSQ